VYDVFYDQWSVCTCFSCSAQSLYTVSALHCKAAIHARVVHAANCFVGCNHTHACMLHFRHYAVCLRNDDAGECVALHVVCAVCDSATSAALHKQCEVCVVCSIQLLH
jgi:hypothetical protein